MKKLILVIVSLVSFTNAAICGPALPPFVPGAYPPIADDVDPSLHLSNLVGKTSGVACIIGDSTSTYGPTLGNNVDPSQIVWWFLTDKLRRDNPQIMTWNFTGNYADGNFGIGATNESNPIQTGTAIGVTLPSWFTDPSQTWLSYVQAKNCDVLFWMFGTNASTSGQSAGNGAATFIRQDFEVINLWSYVPNVIIVSTKPTSPSADTTDDSVSSAHNAQAAFHRTLALSHAKGYTSFPNVANLGFGLVDLGRYFASRVQGFDPAAQYMQSRPDCVVSRKTVVNASLVGTNAGTVCTTQHGDFRLSVTFPAAGGSNLFSKCGSAFGISLSGWVSNYMRFAIGGGGNLVPRFVLDGNISGAPSQAGSSVATTTGQDVTILVSASGMHVQAWVNGTLALDTIGPRYVTGAAGGTPINLVCVTAPGGSLTYNVTEFWEGIGEPTTPIQNMIQAYGTNITPGQTNNCTVANPQCQGGNSINHYRSSAAAADREAINALDFHVPPIGKLISGAPFAPLSTPSSSSASCVQGQIAWDAGFEYVCVAPNTWKRAALSSF